MKKTPLLLGTMICLLLSCETPDEIINLNEDLTTTTNELIDFQGLKVNHRFSLELDKKTKDIISFIDQEIIDNEVPNDLSQISIDDYRLKNPTNLIYVVDQIMPNFPYHKSGEIDLNMIRYDFPLMSDQEIYDNRETIESYYSINFDNEYILKYDSLYGQDSPAVNQKTATTSEYSNAKCLLNEAGYGNVWYNLLDLSYPRALFALYKASKRSHTYSEQEFPPSDYDYADTKRDAYRHIMWNSLLAKYYFTLWSKGKRLTFARKISDANEDPICLSKNNLAAKAMDLHNNYIGRDIWDRNTTYKTTFFAVRYGLNQPSVQLLKDKILAKIDAALYVPVETTSTTSIANGEAIINSTGISTAVYTSRPIPNYNIGDLIIFKPSNGELNMSVDESDGNFSNQIIPRQYYIQSIDNLGINVGDKLFATMNYKGSSAVYNNGSNGLDGLETITISYSGEATVFQSLGNNKFLIGFTDNNGWETESTTQETNILNWQIDFFEVDFSAEYTFK